MLEKSTVLLPLLILLTLAMPTEAALINLSPAAYRAGAAATTSVEAEGESVEKVEASYKQKGHLLALVPVSYTVKVKAHANGQIELDYPWYSFMTLSRRAEKETKLKIAIDGARRTKLLGSVQASGEAEKPEFSSDEAEAIAEEIERVLNEE